MPANDLSLSMHNPILIYSFLALYGLLTVLMLTYVHAKFRTATKTLKLLETEWQSADSRHAGFVGVAQERLSKLAAAPPVPALPLRHTAVSFDLRRSLQWRSEESLLPTLPGRPVSVKAKWKSFWEWCGYSVERRQGKTCRIRPFLPIGKFPQNFSFNELAFGQTVAEVRLIYG